MRVDRFEGGPFAENTWLLTCEATGTRVIMDPGYAVRDVLRVLDEEDASVPEVVLLTHAHLDHVDGIPLLRDRWPDLPIRLHPDDRPLYEAVEQQAAMFGMPPLQLPDPDYDLDEGATLRYGDEIELNVRFSPGHAPGHVIFVDEAGDRAIVGDVVFRGSIGRTDLPGGSHAELLRSIAREILGLPDATRLLPGHGPETTVAEERRSNPFLQSLPAAGADRGDGGAG